MSLDFGLGDLLSVARCALAVYDACNEAPEKFKEVAQICSRISSTCNTLSQEAETAGTVLFIKDPQYAQHIKREIKACKETLRPMELLIFDLAKGDNGLESVTNTIRFTISKPDLNEARQKLAGHHDVLLEFLARLHNANLQALIASLNGIPRGKSVASQPPPATCGEKSKEQDRNAPEPMSSSYKISTQVLVPEASKRKAVKEHQARMLTQYSPPWSGSLKPLTAAEQVKLEPPKQLSRYSTADEWLSQLPEGWQRVHSACDAYKYVYLFKSLGFSSESMPYGHREPFKTTLRADIDPLPSNWQERVVGPNRTWYINTSNGETTFARPSVVFETDSSELIVGFTSADGLPWNLEDSCSRELIRRLYMSGEQPSDFEISQSLPRGWKMYRDLTRSNHPVYVLQGVTSSKERVESTVHPLYFEADLNAHGAGLPRGWERRLDTWANVFYVDHNTATWQREHPKAMSSRSQG